VRQSAADPPEPAASQLSPAAEPASPAAGRAFTLADYGLYLLTVFAWGTSWLALKWQVGVVAPPVSLVWRFSIAVLIMFGWCLIARQPMRFPLRTHIRFAALGLFLFCANFMLMYFSALYLLSGMLAVIFSFAAIVNILLANLVLGDPVRPRVAIGAVIGIAGLSALFWPEISAVGPSTGANGALIGLGLGIVATFSFGIGNMVSAGNQRSGIPLLPASAYGMAYGTTFSAIFAVVSGSAFIIEPTARYLGGLLWLSILSTVIAFWAYLTLLGRIGPDRVGYTTVLFPIVALAISTVVEGYAWTLPAAGGVVLVGIGNLLVLTRRRR